jgi:hypothetical protein
MQHMLILLSRKVVSGTAALSQGKFFHFNSVFWNDALLPFRQKA